MIASIKISFWDKQQIVPIVAALQKVGWEFTDEVIIYDIWQNVNEIGLNRQVVPAPMWQQVSTLLQENSIAGNVVEINLTRDEIDGNFAFHSLQELVVTFDGPRPTLDKCYHYTDFSSLLKLIVCPLEAHGLTTAHVTCVDDRS